MIIEFDFIVKMNAKKFYELNFMNFIITNFY